MSLRRILVLLLLVVALGIYLWVYEIPEARKESEKEKLLAIKPDAVTAVTLVYPDREIELQKDDRGWRLVKPVEARADDAVVKSLLGTLADAEVQKAIDELPENLESFGLVTPKVSVRVRQGDAEPATVSVGKNTPIGGKVYVRRGEEAKLLLTGATVASGLTKQVKDLRDKQLLTFADDDVTRVEIAPAGGAPVVLVRSGKSVDDKQAWVVDPGGHAADLTEIRSYLSSLRSTRATDFPDDAPATLAPYGLDAPRLTVTLTAPGTQVLQLGGERKEGTQTLVYAKRGDQPTVYTVGDWSMRSLAKTASQFRDKTVLSFDQERVGRVTVGRRDGEEIRLARTNDGWQIEGEAGKKTDKDAIERFLDDLRDLRGSDIAAEPATDLAPYGLDAPDLRITVSDKEGQAVGTVLVASRDGKHYVMRAEAPTVYEARDYMYTRLDKRGADFVETAKDPAAPPPDTPEG